MKSNIIKFGVSTLLFRELSLEKALEKISKTDFKKIDLAIVPPTFCPHYQPLETNTEDDKRIKELFDHYQFELSTLNIFPGYFNRDKPEIVSKFIRRCVQIARQLSAHSITIPTGNKVDEKDWLANVKLIKKYLIQEAKVAHNNGIILSIEAPHCGTLTETIKLSKKFFDILDSEFIKCTFDTSHVLRGENSTLLDGIDTIGINKINHVHLRDTINEDISITPGKGHGDFKDFFQRIKESDYKGDIIFELEYHDYSEKQKYEELNFAFEYCNNFYYYNKLPIKLKFKSNKLYQIYKRFSYNPKAEIKRHKNLFMIAKKVNSIVMSLFPDDVYNGSWQKRYRFNKTKIIHHKPQSVVILKNPQEIYKIGIIGCGWAGMQMHGPGFERLNNVQIIGGYDIDKEKTYKFARRFNCKPYNTLEELVQDGKPDIAAICSREWAHYEATIYLLQNDVDVFCEKLMATRYSHARAMVDLAKKHNRVLGINYNYRFMPGIQKIKEIIEKKALGDLSFFNINVHAMAYAHALDLLSYLGGKITTVSGSYKNDNSIRAFGNTNWSLYDEDILYVPSIYSSVICEFENGFIGVVNSSYYYNLNSFVLSIEAVFRLGAITLNGINMYNTIGNLTYISKEKIRNIDMDHKKGVYAKGFEYTFYSSIESFMRAYTRGKPPETLSEQGLFNIELEKAIYRSNKEKTKINFS